MIIYAPSRQNVAAEQISDFLFWAKKVCQVEKFTSKVVCLDSEIAI